MSPLPLVPAGDYFWLYSAAESNKGYYARPQRRLFARVLDFREPFRRKRTPGEMALRVITYGELDMRVRGVPYQDEALRRGSAAFACPERGPRPLLARMRDRNSSHYPFW